MRGATLWVACLGLLGAGCLTQVAQLDPLHDAGPTADTGPACNGTPGLTATPAALNFGAVVAHTTATHLLTLSNCTNLDVVVTLSPISGAYAARFDVDRPADVGFSVPASQAVELHVTYAPLDPSLEDRDTVQTASLALVTHGADTLQIPLQGSRLPSGLTFSPSLLDFGYVPTGTSTLPARLTNLGSVAITIPPPRIVDYWAPAGFTLASGSWNGGILAPGEGQDLAVTFAPAQQWPLEYASAVVLGMDYGNGLSLFGTRALPPQLGCSPASHDLGWAAVNLPKTLSLTCGNSGVKVGEPPGPGLNLTGLSTDNPLFRVQVDPASMSPASAAQPLMLGESLLIDVTYTPSATVKDVATLTVETNWKQTLTVVLTGQGFTHDVGPCSLVLAPSSLDFGEVVLGTSVTSDFSLTNVGVNECLVDAFAISSSCPSVFGIPAGVASQRLATAGGGLYPNALSIPVTFAPLDAGYYSCDLQFGIDAGQPLIATSITGTGAR